MILACIQGGIYWVLSMYEMVEREKKGVGTIGHNLVTIGSPYIPLEGRTRHEYMLKYNIV